jgi:amicyanin
MMFARVAARDPRGSGGLAIALFAALLVLIAPAGRAEDAGRAAPAARAEDVTVKIDNFTFEPQKLTVKVGTTVTWTNDDDIPHTVASSTKAFKSKPLDSEDSFSFTFTTAGTFEYFCSLHPHMTGAIVVEGASGKTSSNQ